ncbi:MAG: alanine racemase [Candidatus Heteroscillospira sp.]|jgi:D-serine deaminase-like pyridoxal phosphate-dependent protein
MQHIETPALIIDMEQVEKNLKSWQEQITAKGCTLRPHIKTHKIVRLARMQMEYGAAGITCAKLGEAETMVAGGMRDVFIAYPIIGKEKVERLLALARQARIICGVDSLAGAKAISEAAVAHGQSIELRMEIDTGYERTGCPVDRAVELAREINALPGVELTGIFTFKCNTLGGTRTLDMAAAGREESEMMVALAGDMRKAGVPIKEISGGSTPTAMYVADNPGMTEVRPGTYIFHDAAKVKQNAAAPEECCGYIKVTVVSTPTETRAVIDGGSKIFAGDTTIRTAPMFLPGYGAVIGRDDLVFDHMSEEHGVIIGKDGGKTGLSVGDTLYIVPNHICTSINLCNYVWIKEKDGSYTRTPVDCRGLFN